MYLCAYPCFPSSVMMKIIGIPCLEELHWPVTRSTTCRHWEELGLC